MSLKTAEFLKFYLRDVKQKQIALGTQRVAKRNSIGCSKITQSNVRHRVSNQRNLSFASLMMKAYFRRIVLNKLRGE